MKIAVVGGTGVFGRRLVSRLVERDKDVVAVSRHPSKPVSGDTVGTHAVCDLLDDRAQSQLQAILAKVDAVVHAATPTPSASAPPEAWQHLASLRREGTARLLSASVAAGVKQFVLVSTAMAYPDRGDEWIYEEEPLDSSAARVDRTAPVAAMEAMVQGLGDGAMKWLILRPGALVGDGTHENAVVERVKSGKGTVEGDGRQYLTVVHVDDLAEAVALALESDKHGCIYNVGATPIRQRDYLENLAVRLHVPPPSTTDTAPQPSIRCSSARFRRELGWQAVRGLGVAE